MAKVFIAIPNIGNVRSELAETLMSFDKKDHECAIYFSQRRPIDCNRNHIVNEFLATDCEYLIMIDSDIVPNKNFLDIIDNDVDICAGDISTVRGKEVIRLGMMAHGEGYRHEGLKEGLNEVDAIGTGFICIKRRVLESMKQPYFQFIYKDGILKLGEDFNFCEEARKMGIKIHFDTRVTCYHYTTLPV